MSMLWRRLPYIIAIATVISTVGVAIAYQLPKIYRATSKILIDALQILSSLLAQRCWSVAWSRFRSPSNE
jgi:uncharacterized protein involved in exopolysaccharide biosynthesis